jgi:hypothetical protein
MVACLSDANGESFVHKISDWSADDSLVGVAYSNVLADSIFVPSPSANVHCECYRTYEALECGAIPVVDSDYYRKEFDAPFPVVLPTWERASEILNTLLDDRDSLQELHRGCQAWWTDIKTSYPRSVRFLAETGQVERRRAGA